MGLNGFVRWTRKLELADQNQLPAGTLGSKTRELVAPSGCCLESGIDSRRSERVGSRKQGCNDQTIFRRKNSGSDGSDTNFLYFRNWCQTRQTPNLLYGDWSAVLRCWSALRFVYRRAPTAILRRF